ncbi:hypothetical protein PCCS19_36670 [Paenibacillus sp. CCS19]|uniref:glycosyl hydrolase family 18 protein n=1 Tax=Paenibacillus sp. CCS19 TaxID=3158387 RepID=UPI0025630A30|nr:glycosyl hydrolase family 18 protein [Paenibacillus cellulosilyticus]GMK40611.1 hypothetical protein PCCS19_36670 [Paenibacillus cellulosilyticus]
MNISMARQYVFSLPLYLMLALIIGSMPITPVAAAADAASPPTNLHIAKDADGKDLITDKSVTIAWDLIGDDSNNNDIDIWDADTGAWVTWGDRSHMTLGVKPSTTYKWYITWYTDRGKDPMPKSNVIEFTTLADTSEYPEPPLVAPQYLHTTAVTDTSITLDWTPSPDATGYDIYVNGSWFGGVWNGTDHTFTYTIPEGGNLNGTSYEFVVSAQNAGVTPLKVSAGSNPVSITWGKLLAPQALQVITTNRSTASLGWARVDGATAYDIYTNGKRIGTSQEARYVAKGLQEGKRYALTVIAKNSLWQSDASGSAVTVPGADYNIVSYYPLWSASASGRGFLPADVDPTQLTHVNLAFSDVCWHGVSSNGSACQNETVPTQNDYVFDGEMVVGDPSADLTLFDQWAAIRDANSNLKLMISVGGWSWSNNFSNMASTEQTRRHFANSVVEFLRAYHLDGLDIDWEYPVEGGEEDNSRSPEDADNFLLMVKTVREALDAAGSEDGSYYLLTIAASQGDNFIVNAKLADSSKYLDYINIMTYDYSGSWEAFAHHNSPLYYDKNHPKDYAARNNVQGAILAELNGGVPGYKIQPGIPFYGKGWSGCTSGGEYAACTSALTPFGTWENGVFDYSDIENNYLTNQDYEYHWNEASKVASLYNAKDEIFITYNNADSIMYLTSLVRSLNLAGVMSWEISGDRDRTLSTQLAKDLPTSGIVNPDQLAAPTNVSTVIASLNKAVLKWDPSANASAYEVYADGVYVGTTTNTHYLVDGLSAGQPHTLRVLAINRQDGVLKSVSNFSSTAHLTTLKGTFSTSKALSRAELVSMIVKGLGITPVDSVDGPVFNDVPADSPFAADIAAAKHAGIILTSGSNFNPTGAVSREEFAIMLHRVLKQASDDPVSADALNRFSDKSAVSSDALDALAFVVDRKLLLGVSADKLAPQASITEAQATEIIVRAIASAL